MEEKQKEKLEQVELETTPVKKVVIEPRIVKAEEPKEEVKKSFEFDTNTVIYIFYLMYKENLLTRRHVKSMFNQIKKELPGDITKYLVEESTKCA